MSLETMSLVSAPPAMEERLMDHRKTKRPRNSINGQRSPSPEVRAVKRAKPIVHPWLASKFQTESVNVGDIPKEQKVLLLRCVGIPYETVEPYETPRVDGPNSDELILKVLYVGLNPIDWKVRDFGFGIPVLPYLAGRDIVGVVMRSPRLVGRVKKGDVVLTASTDYRDLRKAAFQSYAIAPSYNVCRIPPSAARHSVAGLGVAFVAAFLILGVCLGVDFSKKPQLGPNLREVLRGVNVETIPEDVRDECLNGISAWERPQKGDWIVIWGGSSATAKTVAQLSKIVGLRVIKVVDVAKHGDQLSESAADLLVDSLDPERAVEIIRNVTNNQLRFAVDTVGKTTAELCQKVLRPNACALRSHLVALSGLPKERQDGIVYHNVPMKIHHEVQEAGEAMMRWLERLLREGLITPPKVVIAPGGLEGINDALDRMKKGEISGKRVIVQLA